MPRELIAAAPRTPALVEYREPDLGAGQVRLRSLLSVVKHGTELRAFRADTRDATAPFDRELRMHLPGERPDPFPHPLGNQGVARVMRTGTGAERFRPGDLVFGPLPIRETHTVAEESLQPAPAGAAPEALLCWDPASVALCGIHDSGIRVGDRVLVTGLGAIGLMAAQLARLQGASWVACSDPIAKRRTLAAAHGADLVIDPAAGDAGLIVKQRSGSRGADVSIEASGSYAGLHDALRATAYGGTVVSIAYYTGSAGALHLQGEWHRNQLTLISSRNVNAPLRADPRWTSDRLHRQAVDLLAAGRLRADGVLDPIVPFERSADAYREIDRNPGAGIKLAVRYDDGGPDAAGGGDAASAGRLPR